MNAHQEPEVNVEMPSPCNLVRDRHLQPRRLNISMCTLSQKTPQSQVVHEPAGDVSRLEGTAPVDARVCSLGARPPRSNVLAKDWGTRTLSSLCKSSKKHSFAAAGMSIV